MKVRLSFIAAALALGAALAHAEAREPRKVSVGAVELRYIEQGKGEPLILLHGGQGDYRSWRTHIEALSQDYRVISYSRRYHYPNDNPLRPDHSALVDAEDLAALIASLELGSAHFVGTSYGAFVALAFATAHPERVRTLVLAEPPVLAWAAQSPAGAPLYREFMDKAHRPAGQAFAAGQDETALRILIDEFDGAGTFAGLPAQRRAQIVQNARFFKAVTASSNPFPDLAKDAVAALKAPVLIVRGERTDELHKFVTDELARVLPSARSAVIPQAGHGSPRQNAPAFIAAVREFLERAGR